MKNEILWYTDTYSIYMPACRARSMVLVKRKNRQQKANKNLVGANK